MEQTIEQVLQVLIGLPLWSSGRGYEVQWFQFGERRELPGRWRNMIRLVGDYTLNVQCNWRLVEASKVVVGMGDRYYPPNDWPETEVFNWREHPLNRGDELLEAFMNRHREAPPIVTAIWVGDAGYVRFSLGGGMLFEIFPHDSFDEEYFRLLKPGDTSKHYVVDRNGLTVDQ